TLAFSSPSLLVCACRCTRGQRCLAGLGLCCSWRHQRLYQCLLLLVARRGGLWRHSRPVRSFRKLPHSLHDGFCGLVVGRIMAPSMARPCSCSLCVLCARDHLWWSAW